MTVGASVGFALGVLAFIGFLFSTLSSEWKKTSPLDNQSSLNRLYASEGLWVRCNVPVAGQYQCDQYETGIIGLDGYLTGLRAMMIISCIAGLTGLGLGLMSLQCIHAVKGNTKAWMGRLGGGLILLGSLLCIAAVSWYASIVVHEYWQDQLLDKELQYVFGAAVYVGWVAGGLGFIGAILLVCFQDSGLEQEDYGYNYQPPKSKKARDTEYV